MAIYNIVHKINNRIISIVEKLGLRSYCFHNGNDTRLLNQKHVSVHSRELEPDILFCNETICVCFIKETRLGQATSLDILG